MANEAEKTESESTLGRRLAEKANSLKYIIIALIVLVVASAAFFHYQRRQQEQQLIQSENALYQTILNTTAATGDALAVFGKAADDYKGLPAGLRARILQFSYAFNTRDFAAAERAARDILATYNGNPMLPRVRLALAQALVEQDKFPEAISTFRDLVSSGNAAILPEAQIALAQALELEAEAVRDDEALYRQRLEAAMGAYNDIVVRSTISIPSQRGYWPPEIILPAEFALVVIKDKLNGYQHPSPRPLDSGAVTAADIEAAQLIAPPSDEAASDTEATEEAATETESEAETE